MPINLIDKVHKTFLIQDYAWIFEPEFALLFFVKFSSIDNTKSILTAFTYCTYIKLQLLLYVKHGKKWNVMIFSWCETKSSQYLHWIWDLILCLCHIESLLKFLLNITNMHAQAHACKHYIYMHSDSRHFKVTSLFGPSNVY